MRDPRNILARYHPPGGSQSNQIDPVCDDAPDGYMLGFAHGAISAALVCVFAAAIVFLVYGA